MILVHPSGGGAIYSYDYMQEKVESKSRAMSCKEATVASNRRPSDEAVSCNLHHPCDLNTWCLQQALDEFISFSLTIPPPPPMRPLPSRSELWKHLMDEIDMFPCSSFDWQVDPLNEPLDHRFIVPWDHPPFQ
jgi:hypothetical protein